MKKNTIFATMALICLLTTSCSDTMNEPTLESRNNTEYHGVPLEEALEHLKGVINAMEEPTRSSATRRIGSVNVVRSKDLATRSIASGVTDVDSLIYVVNFEDNQGFAYLAADDRISSPVIYVADSGSVNLNGGSFGDPIGINIRPFYPGYPTDGPGIIYDDNATDVVYINPNTFDFYDSEQDDSYVGDFFLNGNIDYQNMISQVNEHVYNYIDNEIGNEYGDGDLSDFDGIGYDDPSNPGEITNVVKSVAVSRDTIVNKLLNFAKGWCQDYPLNEYCPTVKKLFSSEQRVADVGCVPLAIAKIMAYHQFPNAYTINGTNINWSLVRNFALSIAKSQTAKLLRHIGVCSGSIYGYKGTFTFPSAAAAFLRSINYNGVSYTSYNEERVTNMLDNNCPVFVCAIPLSGTESGLTKCHAWNIDGYMKHTTTVRKDYYVGNLIVDTTINTTEKTMVHCDFGWEGYCNGYFTSGVFNLYGDDVEFDNPGHYKTYDVNYNFYLKMITYNKPVFF